MPSRSPEYGSRLGISRGEAFERALTEEANDQSRLFRQRASGHRIGDATPCRSPAPDAVGNVRRRTDA